MKKNMIAWIFIALALLGQSCPAGATAFLKTHKEVGVSCKDCHGQNKKDLIANTSCLACHESFEALGEQTSDMHLNPHLSPHFMDLECTSCHQGHEKLDNFCQQCHGPISRH